MIVAVIGLLKQPCPPRDGAFEAQLNEHLAQPHLRIVNAGYLRDAQGESVGVMALIEVETFALAQAYLENSPFHRCGHFERAHVVEYDLEVGRLG
jgi:uncharacterized protein YciI